jgi:hypothetical protein
VPITPAPAERFAVGALHAAEIDAAGGEHLQLVHRVIRADDADESHRREVAGRRGEEGPGAA